MTIAYDSKRGVMVNYGERKLGGAVGVIGTVGTSNELAFDVTGDMLNDGYIHTVKLPKGSKPIAVYYEVKESFTLGGTTPTILIGTDGSEVTNGCVVSETIAEGTGAGTVTSTLTGTWASAAVALAAETTVGVALGGTNPTAARSGRLRVVIEYIKIGTQS